MKTTNRKLQWWLDEYSKSHRNPINKTIHYFCVPIIVTSLMGLLMNIPQTNYLPKNFNCCLLVIFFSLIFYASISLRHTIYMTLFFLFCYSVNITMTEVLGQKLFLYSCILMFVVSWILQFIGHVIEGKKPSFLRDIQFLLIGPLWIMDHIMNMFSN